MVVRNGREHPAIFSEASSNEVHDARVTGRNPSSRLSVHITPMLLTIATILLVLWFLGIVTSYTIGGFIHLLLLIAIVMVLIRLIRGEKIL